MAYDLNGTTQYFGTGSAVVSGPPFTVSVVFRADDELGQEALFSISDNTDGGNQHALFIGTILSGSGDTIGALSRDAGIFEHSAISTTGITAGKIHQAAGVWRATNDRSAYLDGGSRGNAIGTSVPSGLNVTDIGRLGDVSPNWEFGGMEAEIAVWNVALTDAEIAWLGKLFSPLTLTHRIGNLVLYQDLIRGLNRPGIGPTFTAFNSPVVVSHPRVIYPSAPIIGIPIAAVAAAANPWYYYAQQ